MPVFQLLNRNRHISPHGGAHRKTGIRIHSARDIACDHKCTRSIDRLDCRTVFPLRRAVQSDPENTVHDDIVRALKDAVRRLFHPKDVRLKAVRQGERLRRGGAILPVVPAAADE